MQGPTRPGLTGPGRARPGSNRAALAAPAVSAFAIGTTEFVISGVLPEVAATFRITIPTAGLLVSGYALGVVAGAPAVTAAVLYLPRKQVLIGLLVLFIAGNVVTATAPGYGVMMAGRVLAALCHGAFLGIGSAVAADLADPDRKARAIATMFAGLTVANVAGVPFGTFLGQHFGWRSTFWAIAGLGVLSMLSIAILVPPVDAASAGRMRAELAAFRGGQLWLALGITALGFGAVYAPFTYIAPMMTVVAHFPPSAVAWLLIVFGLGLVLGNPLGARAADRHLMITITVLLAMLIAVLLVFDRTARARGPAAATLFALGVVGFAMVPAFTSRVLAAAGGAASNIMASSAAVAAFNLGNAAGAFLGGRAIAGGHGFASPSLVGAAMAGCALLLALLSAAASRLRLPAGARAARGSGPARNDDGSARPRGRLHGMITGFPRPTMKTWSAQKRRAHWRRAPKKRGVRHLARAAHCQGSLSRTAQERLP